MTRCLDNHLEKLRDELEQRFPERSALVAWLFACVEAKAGRESTALRQHDALRGLAESDGCVDFQEWIDAASHALDDAFLQEHADDEAILEKGCVRIQLWQKRLYPWRTQDLKTPADLSRR